MTVEYDFSGCVVSITGAAAGFGKRAAERFAVAGATLVLSDVDQDGLDTIAAQLTDAGSVVLAVACDISQDEQVRALFDRAQNQFGGVDIAVNNAGIIQPMARLADCDEEMFDQNIAVNLKGTFLCMRYALRQMAEKGAGRIVNIASASGLVGSPFLSIYAAAKHGVIGLTRSAAIEYGRKGIQVNALCPSFSPTSILDEVVAQKGEQVVDGIANNIPMQRLAEPDEVVSAILWLCCDDNSYMNGAAVSVDGGLVAG